MERARERGDWERGGSEGLRERGRKGAREGEREEGTKRGRG